MKISIITATIDSDERLGRTIDSVRNQTHLDIEHIIVDGVANRPVPARAIGKVIYHEPRGIYEALNFGISQVTGDIVGLVHGGDALASNEILEKVAAAFEADLDLDFVYGDVCYVSESGRRGRIYSSRSFKPSHLSYGMAPPHPSLYMRKEMVERIGKYREDFRLAADLDMWMRIFGDRSFKGQYLPHIFVEMAFGGASTSFKSRLFGNNMEKLKALRLNGYPANPLKLFMKYILIFRDLMNIGH